MTQEVVFYVTERKRGDEVKTVAERIRDARKNKGWSALELAKACEITESAVQMYECGKRVPRDEIKIKMAEVLETSVQDLFF